MTKSPPVPTRRVELALRAPVTWIPSPNELLAVEIKPVRVDRPKTLRVPLALTLPLESTVNLPLLKVVGV